MVCSVRSVAGKVVKPPVKCIDYTETCKIPVQPSLYIFTDDDVLILSNSKVQTFP